MYLCFRNSFYSCFDLVKLLQQTAPFSCFKKFLTGQGKDGVEVGAARAVEPEPFGTEEGLVPVAVIITKIVCVCRLLFIEYLFATYEVVFQTIIGLFAVFLSNFDGFIDDIIDYINGYNFTSMLAAYLPNDSGLFVIGNDIYFKTALLSSICGIISGFFACGFASAIDTRHDTGFSDNKALTDCATIAKSGVYFHSFGIFLLCIISYYSSNRNSSRSSSGRNNKNKI